IELASVTVMFDIDGDGATTGPGESVLADKTGVNLYTAEFPNIAGPNGSRTVSVVAADTSTNTSPAEIPVTVGGVEPTTETLFTDSGHIDAQPSVWSGGSQQVIDYDPIAVPGSGTLTFIVTATPPVRHENQNIPRADPYVRNINFNGTDYSLNADCNDFGADPSICTTTFEATEGGTLHFEILGPGTWNIWGEFSGHHEQDYTIEIEFTSVDITRPEVSVTSPELGADVDLGTPLTVELSVIDDVEVASVVVSFDGDGDGDTDDFGEQLAATSTGGDAYQAAFGDLSGIPGTRTIQVLATDTSFNTTRKNQTVGVGGVGAGEMVLAATSGTIPAQPNVWQGGERQIIDLDPIVVPGMGRITFVVTATPNVRQEVQNIPRYDSTVTKINFDGGDITLTPVCNAPGSDPAVCISVWDSPGDGVLDSELLGPATYNTWGEFSGHGEQDYTIEVLFLPGPTVTEVIPDTGSVGGHETVTVRGSGFDYNAVVLFDEVPGTDVVWVSSEEITCTTPPGLPGSTTVRVLNPDPEGLGWNYGGPYGLFGELENGFTYEAAPPPQPLQAERLLGTYKDYFPAVGSEEPQQQASFDFNIPAAGRLRFEAWAFIPILNPIPGPFDNPENLEWHNESTAVRFFTGGNGAGHWPQIEYSDLSYPFGPVIGNSTRVVGSGAQGPGEFTVKGPARWNAFWRQFGEYEMVSAPAQNWSLAVWFAGPPSLTSVFPAAGSEAGGTTVTLTGANFAEGIQVRFGGELATDVVVSNENTLTCTAPPGLAGPVSVAVELLDMTAPLTEAFTYEADVQRKAITEFSFSAEGTPTIWVQTQVGRTYQLERNDDLTNPFGWVHVGDQFAGSGAEEPFTDPTLSPASYGMFYRFVIRE
ncbi:IPT/TIG domain-containing protein, partial [bacterium]|nr:IPT/TIG domain-containing protein [bacterium]